MKIVLVHDSFTQAGGAERVMDILHDFFPQAAVYTLVLDKKLQSKYQDWKINLTWLQFFYNLLPKLQYWLFFMPWAVGSIKISEADVVLSSSSGFVKNIKVPKNAVHINYCHTPTRFLWVNSEYLGQEVFWLLRPLVKVFLRAIKPWDYKGAQRVNFFVANSREVQKRIKQIYNRESEIIYPPIDTGFWHATRPKQNYFLLAGRLQAHKKSEFVVECFNRLGLALHVVGTGRQEKYLKSIAKPNITFFGRVSDNDLRNEYSGAKALIYPQIEDFGLMPLEAASCGTATIAFAKGGALETVKEGQTGEFFEEYNQDKIMDMILQWKTDKYLSGVLRSHAQQFNILSFKEQILKFINAKSI